MSITIRLPNIFATAAHLHVHSLQSNASNHCDGKFVTFPFKQQYSLQKNGFPIEMQKIENSNLKFIPLEMCKLRKLCKWIKFGL